MIKRIAQTAGAPTVLHNHKQDQHHAEYRSDSQSFYNHIHQ